jgi:hypothetical protein
MAKSRTPKRRKVDAAMSENRLAKMTIRNFWADEAETFDAARADDGFPVYLTLSGAEARDIHLLIDRGVISTTETGGIAEKDQGKVVAIENNAQAVLSLKKQFIGLHIIEQDFGGILRGESPLVYPDKQHRRLCCASVVNLDLNASLPFHLESGKLVFPFLTWIAKLSQLHQTVRPGVDWCLCLTLNATINNANDLAAHVQDFLKENFELSSQFKESCRAFLGDNLQNQIVADEIIDLNSFDQEACQKLLMVFVPKKIANMVHAHGWKLSTIKNLAYDGANGHAPMVTWIFYFRHDERAAATPHAVYRDALIEILPSAAKIMNDGSIEEFIG